MIVLLVLLWIAGVGPTSAGEIQVTAAQRAALAAAKTIRVSVEQSYRVKDGPAVPEVSLPVEQTALTMLRAAGRQIVGPETTTADGSLTIRIEGATVKLLDSSKLDHYMSAELAGEIRLVAAGVSLRAPFSGASDRFFGSTGRYVRADEFRHPRDAPFLQALGTSKYVAVLTEMVEAVSGVDRSELLVALIGDATFSPTALALLRESPGPRVAEALSTAIRVDLGATSDLTVVGKRLETMVEALGALNDARAAPTLLAVLQSRSSVVFKTARASAVSALGRLKEREAAVPIAVALTEKHRRCRRAAEVCRAPAKKEQRVEKRGGRRRSRPPKPSATIRQCTFLPAHVQIFLVLRPRMCYSAPVGKKRFPIYYLLGLSSIPECDTVLPWEKSNFLSKISKNLSVGFFRSVSGGSDANGQNNM